MLRAPLAELITLARLTVGQRKESKVGRKEDRDEGRSQRMFVSLALGR